MNRCAACGMFFDTAECPGDHSHVTTYLPPRAEPAQRCLVCGQYFLGADCPYQHDTSITIGSAVTCDVTGQWSDVESLPGIVVAVEGDSYRVIVALPGERGSTAALTLPAERIS